MLHAAPQLNSNLSPEQFPVFFIDKLILMEVISLSALPPIYRSYFAPNTSVEVASIITSFRKIYSPPPLNQFLVLYSFYFQSYYFILLAYLIIPFFSSRIPV